VAGRHAAIYADRRLPRFRVWRIESRLYAGRNPLSQAAAGEAFLRGSAG
jgi:hypothetical protein